MTNPHEDIPLTHKDVAGLYADLAAEYAKTKGERGYVRHKPKVSIEEITGFPLKGKIRGVFVLAIKTARQTKEDSFVIHGKDDAAGIKIPLSDVVVRDNPRNKEHRHDVFITNAQAEILETYIRKCADLPDMRKVYGEMVENYDKRHKTNQEPEAALGNLVQAGGRRNTRHILANAQEALTKAIRNHSDTVKIGDVDIPLTDGSLRPTLLERGMEITLGVQGEGVIKQLQKYLDAQKVSVKEVSSGRSPGDSRRSPGHAFRSK